MRALFLLAACFALGACQERNRPYDNRVLWDKNGCAYWSRAGAGDITFLTFNEDASKPECPYERKDARK